MEYVFGYRRYDGKDAEYLRTSDKRDFSKLAEGSFMTHVFQSESQTVTHNFRVIRKYKEVLDDYGNYLSWYLIDNHTKEIDKTAPINSTLTTHTSQLQEQSDAIDDIIISILGE